MTPPPPVLSGLQAGNRGGRRSAPVSDRPVGSLLAASSLPPGGVVVSLPEAFFVGIDWAAETHAVCVLKASGRVTAEFTVAHTANGFADLRRRLDRLAEDPAEVPISIERPDGRLVDGLLEAGHPVVPVKPNAIKTWRGGEVLSGAKCDADDAHVIAEYLRLRSPPASGRDAVRQRDKGAAHRGARRDDLVEMRVAATNQLCALLDTGPAPRPSLPTWRA
jgi:transposase